MSLPSQPSRVYLPLEAIPASGIYRVWHGGHRAAHEVTLLLGEPFPECNNCGRAVRFELVRAIPHLEDRDFHVRLHQIPHPRADAA